MDMVERARYCLLMTGVQPLGGLGGHGSLTLISEPKQVQQFQFQTSGVFLFTGVQEIYGPEISQFLPCMLQFLDNLRWHFTFSSYIGEIDHFRLTFSKGPILSPGHSEMFLIMDHPTEDLNEQEFKRQIINGILGLIKKSPKTLEASI